MRKQREDIRALLLADPKIAELVTDASSQRVYFGKASASTPSPFVIIRLAGTQRQHTHDQTPGTKRKRADRLTWEIIAASEDGDEASDLAELIDDALDCKEVGETSLLLFEDASDTSDFRQDQSGNIIHQISTMFMSRRRPYA